MCFLFFFVCAGPQVWEELNCVFDRLPLAAVIDRDIFCIHGGIPRPLPNSPEGASRLDMIAKIPAVRKARLTPMPSKATPGGRMSVALGKLLASRSRP
jgi:diadenosine tetraphosphatase ApaH/serine/threonine PP2A family protein phosphatase